MDLKIVIMRVYVKGVRRFTKVHPTPRKPK